MPSTKLTKSVVNAAKATTRDYEIRDTIVPGFLCKITPAGRKTFMLSYRTPNRRGDGEEGESCSEGRVAEGSHRSPHW